MVSKLSGKELTKLQKEIDSFKIEKYRKLKDKVVMASTKDYKYDEDSCDEEESDFDFCWRELAMQGKVDASEYKSVYEDWCNREDKSMTLAQFLGYEPAYERDDTDDDEDSCEEESDEEDSCEEESDDQDSCEEESDYWECRCGRNHEMDESCRDCKRWMCGCDPGEHRISQESCLRCRAKCPKKQT